MLGLYLNPLKQILLVLYDRKCKLFMAKSCRPGKTRFIKETRIIFVLIPMNLCLNHKFVTKIYERVPIPLCVYLWKQQKWLNLSRTVNLPAIFVYGQPNVGLLYDLSFVWRLMDPGRCFEALTECGPAFQLAWENYWITSNCTAWYS